MSTALQRKYTPEEYLALEEVAEYRSEYFQGEIFAMAGGTPRHNDIALNLIDRLRGQLRGGNCKANAFDLRVLVKPTGLRTYPDIVVTCGQRELEGNTLLNPRVLMEVLSPSTEKYDRGMKFEHYRQISALQEYILVSQFEPHIERFVRQTDGSWLMTEAKGLESSIALDAVGWMLSLAEAYEGVTFDPEESPGLQDRRGD